MFNQHFKISDRDYLDSDKRVFILKIVSLSQFRDADYAREKSETSGVRPPLLLRNNFEVDEVSLFSPSDYVCFKRGSTRESSIFMIYPGE